MNHSEKLESLKSYLKELKYVAVSYSGGVDSTFLLTVALQTLGRDRVRAVMVLSDITPPWDVGFARSFLEDQEIRYHMIEAEEMIKNPEFKANTPERCYHCKVYNHKQIRDILPDEYVIVSGTNFSDTRDVRPGLKAEAECGVRTPLKDLEFTKDEVRLYSKRLGISGWDRPSSACLVSRISFGIPIQKNELFRVRDAELFLRKLGFDAVRVRFLPGKTAKIELDRERIREFTAHHAEVVRVLKELGFATITLDLEGYVPAGIKHRETNDGSADSSGE